MLEMTCPCGAIDEYIIEENKHKLAEERFEYRVHQGLKSGRRIGENKRHHQELEMSMMSSERCFRNVINMNSDLVMARFEIQFREEASAIEFI